MVPSPQQQIPKSLFSAPRESSSGSFRVFLPFSRFHCHHKCKAIIMLKNNGLFITHDAKNGASRQPGHLKDERAQFTIKSGRRFHLRSIQEESGDGGPHCKDILISLLTPLIHLHDSPSAPQTHLS